MYKRNCPLCNKIIVYKKYKTFWAAKKYNSRCSTKCFGKIKDKENNKICSVCRTEKSKKSFSINFGRTIAKCKDCCFKYRKKLSKRDLSKINYIAAT